MIDIIGLFPTPVSLSQERSPTPSELGYMLELEKMPNVANKNSAFKQVLDNEELSDLKRMIQERVDLFFNTVYCPKDASLVITQSWCNYSDQGQGHHQHNHPNSAISGVYYPQAESIDRLSFHTPLMPHLHMRVDPNTLNEFTAYKTDVEVKTGVLVMFPSYLEHSVDPVKDREETRISLSFNTFYKGQLGDDVNATGLKL